MAAKLEVLITERNGRMEFDVKGSGERTPREDAHLAAMIAVIRAVVRGLDKRAAECDCPACQKKRKQEVNHEPQNLH